uniref:Cyclic nucleotide-gated channel C-terminal leucine zipper domain-containing protein n=1 Tax=Megaselia scalaris TaxID=36166 RepID=T1GI25_MEGSC
MLVENLNVRLARLLAEYTASQAKLKQRIAKLEVNHISFYPPFHLISVSKWNSFLRSCLGLTLYKDLTFHIAICKSLSIMFPDRYPSIALAFLYPRHPVAFHCH